MVDGPGRFDNDGTTDLHAFSLSDDDATYLGSGEVEGSVADRWAMDSADGVLRVAVGATGDTGNFNSVVTFGERDGALVELGRVDRLGVDEQIKAVRWFDDLAFVVTFRQTDPLYAIDLADPAAPRVLGKLKIPGLQRVPPPDRRRPAARPGHRRGLERDDPRRAGGGLRRLRPHPPGAGRDPRLRRTAADPGRRGPAPVHLAGRPPYRPHRGRAVGRQRRQQRHRLDPRGRRGRRR